MRTLLVTACGLAVLLTACSNDTTDETAARCEDVYRAVALETANVKRFEAAGATTLAAASSGLVSQYIEKNPACFPATPVPSAS